MTWLKSVWQFAARVGRRFFADACSGRAAGLAFSTLFSLVPLSAFVVAVLNAFGAFDYLAIFQRLAKICRLLVHCLKLLKTLHRDGNGWFQIRLFDGLHQVSQDVIRLGTANQVSVMVGRYRPA